MKAAAGRGLAGLTRLEEAVAVAALCLAAAALLADIVTRELFSFGLFGALRVAVYATAVAALTGFPICVAHGAHLRISLFDAAVPARLLPAVLRAGHLLSAAICLYLAWWGGFYVRQTFGLGESDPSLGVEVWPMQLVLPWMFLSGALRYLAFAAWPDLAPAEREPAS